MFLWIALKQKLINIKNLYNMGRNGKAIPVFSRMVKLVNDNVGKIITSEEMLLGNEPGRNSVTAYIYKFVKLGYIEMANEGEKGILSKETTYRIKKVFPDHYNSVMLMDELRIYNGLIPEKRDFERTLGKIK